MDTADSELTAQQYEEMKLGYTALWALVLKNRACLERLLSLNREINTVLSLKVWDHWIDFQALLARYEPALDEASAFLQELDAVVEENDIHQLDLITYGQQLVLEMKSSTVKPLVAKFRKLAHTTQIEVDATQAARLLAQIEAEDRQLRRNQATRAGYIPNGDGTVTDTHTQLMWMQCAEGQEGPQCEGHVLLYTWDSAMGIPTKLNERAGFAGYTDWRLPTAAELQSLVRTDSHPTICNDAFPNAPVTLIWSSTLVKEGGRDAWNVYFGSGSMGSNDRDNHYAVRLVRKALRDPAVIFVDTERQKG
jgi:Protein of unknown function (DUF1566)